MNKRETTSILKRIPVLSSVATPSTVAAGRRLTFEPMERRVMLSATAIEMPALRQEYVSESFVVPLEGEMLSDVVEPPVALPMGSNVDSDIATVFRELPNTYEPGDFAGLLWNIERTLTAGDMQSQELFDSWAASINEGISQDRDISVPAPDFREGGFIDIAMVGPTTDAQMNRPLDILKEEDGQFTREIADDVNFLLVERDHIGEPGDATFGGMFAEDPSLLSSNREWWITDGERLEPGGDDFERGWSPNAMGNADPMSEWHVNDWFNELPSDLRYSTAIHRASDAFGIEIVDAYSVFFGIESWMPRLSFDGEHVLKMDAVAMKHAHRDVEALFDPTALSADALEFTNTIQLTDQNQFLLEGQDGFRVRVVEGDYQTQVFAASSVFGNEFSADAAVAVPMLVAEHPTGFALTRVLDVLGLESQGAPSAGGFVDVGLVAMGTPATALAAANGTGTREATEIGELPPEEAMPEISAGAEMAADTEMADTLLSIEPEAGVLMEADLTSVGTSSPESDSLAASHDAAFEEVAEGPRMQVAGFEHFWAPTLFALSALGRQVWIKKKRKDETSSRTSNAGRVSPPTVGFGLDEDTDPA